MFFFFFFLNKYKHFSVSLFQAEQLKEPVVVQDDSDLEKKRREAEALLQSMGIAPDVPTGMSHFTPSSYVISAVNPWPRFSGVVDRLSLILGAVGYGFHFSKMLLDLSSWKQGYKHKLAQERAFAAQTISDETRV